MTDQTNADRGFARNRVRLDVVPALKAVNPALEREIAGMTARLARDEAYLQEEAQRAVERAKTPNGYSRTELAALPTAILVRALERILRRAGGAQPEAIHLEQAAAMVRAGRGSLSAPGGIQLAVQGNTLFVAQKPLPPWSLPVTGETTRLPDGRMAALRKIHKKDLENQNKFKNLLFHNCINYDTITSKLFFRNRREGDCFRPAKRGVSKSLKKLFNEAKIEPLLRDRILLLEDGKEILWMEGFGPSERARVPKDAEQMLLITVWEPEEAADQRVSDNS